jgi:hypothetical protein
MVAPKGPGHIVRRQSHKGASLSTVRLTGHVLNLTPNNARGLLASVVNDDVLYHSL